MPSNQRIGHAERDEAVRRLQEHSIDGRLTPEEFEERMGAAMQARTSDDLRPLFADLPDADWMLPGQFAMQRPREDLVEVQPVGQSRWVRYWWLIPAVLVGALLTRGMLGIALPLVFFWIFVGAPRGDRRPPLHYRRGNLEEQVQVLCRAGRRVEAIKAYREQVPGADLYEAKRAVDQIAARDLGGY